MVHALNTRLMVINEIIRIQSYAEAHEKKAKLNLARRETIRVNYFMRNHIELFKTNLRPSENGDLIGRSILKKLSRLKK